MKFNQIHKTEFAVKIETHLNANIHAQIVILKLSLLGLDMGVYSTR